VILRVLAGVRPVVLCPDRHTPRTVSLIGTMPRFCKRGDLNNTPAEVVLLAGLLLRMLDLLEPL
jgi:hypothetical protein